MVTAQKGVSLRPSDFVEGGAVPVDQNLVWKESRFCLFDYQGKAPPTVAFHAHYVNDSGQEYDQYYSAGDPERFQPSEDGKQLVPQAEGIALSKSSNFYLLMSNLINAGFPENRITGDISVLDGLYTHNIGIPEPKRAGLEKAPPADGSTVRAKVISVPDRVLRLPWEKKGGKVVPVASKKGEATEAPAADGQVTVAIIGIVSELVEKAESGSTTRQLVAGRIFKDKNLGDQKSAAAQFLFTPAMKTALEEAGFAMDGETISKAD